MIAFYNNISFSKITNKAILIVDGFRCQFAVKNDSVIYAYIHTEDSYGSHTYWYVFYSNLSAIYFDTSGDISGNTAPSGFSLHLEY